jgi:aspartate aminotransferase
MTDTALAGQAQALLQAQMGFFRLIMDPEIAQVLGDPDVCDFAAGNPQELASAQYVATLQRWAEPKDKTWYAYKGMDPGAQEAAAAGLTRELGMSFEPADIILTRGAHGGITTSLKVVADPGDEVIYISPPWFFYEAIILATGATPVKVRIDADTFDLDLASIEAAITERTRAVLINTPHNPTGRIYPAATLRGLAEILYQATSRHGRRIYLVSDESYSRILFDGNRFETPGTFYPFSLLIHTYSKSALAPGQRLGYVALPPSMPDREELRMGFLAVAFATGTGLPDAIMQYALADIEQMSIDLEALQRKRDRMVPALRAAGYELHLPEATFYLLPRSPDPDDMAFALRLARDKVVVLPGRAVEMPGYFRISLTATEAMIERALPVFAAAATQVG